MTEQQTATRFSVGQHVHITSDRVFDWDTGTVIEVIEGDGDTETAYRVEEFQHRDEREQETFPSSQLEPDDSGWLDTDNLTEIRAELEAVCSSRSKYGGLHAERGEDRIIAAGRVSWLAGRLTWLEACDLRSAADRATARAEPTGHEI